MPRYVVEHRYGSRRDGEQYGPWDAGREIEMTEADAEWINRDSPGALSPVEAKEPEHPEPAPVVEAPVAEPSTPVKATKATAKAAAKAAGGSDKDG